MIKGDVVEIVYLAGKSGAITQRYIRILKSTEHYIRAYCYTRHQVRVFRKANILAARKIRSA